MPIPMKELRGWSRVIEDARLLSETIPTRETSDSLLFEDDRLRIERARDAESPRVVVRLADRERTLVLDVDERNLVHTLRAGRWMAFVSALATSVREERRRRAEEERAAAPLSAEAFSPVDEGDLFDRFELSLPEAAFEKSALAEPALPFDPTEEANYPDDSIDWDGADEENAYA